MQTFVRYVGIPALVIAAVAPVVNLFGDYREFRNKQYLVATYNAYGADLLERGLIDRASAILSDLEQAQKRDTRTQYMITKIASMQAIKQGKSYQAAEDRINLLLRLHRDRGLLFPRLGGPDEVFELEISLVDIATKEGDLANAERTLKELTDRYVNDEHAIVVGQLQLRRGTLAVLRYQFGGAQSVLDSALASLARSKRVDLVADTRFQLGKSYQFAQVLDTAIVHYAVAESLYTARSDKFNLLNVYNNMAMVYFDRHDDARAKYFYGQSASVARDVGDQLGIARAVYNLSLVAKRVGEYSVAIQNMLEAQEAFRASGNRLGIAAALQGLGDIYTLTGDLSKGLYHSGQAAVVFQELRELRGLADTYSTMSRLEEEVGNDAAAVQHALFAYILRRHIGKPDAVRNLADLRGARARLGDTRFGRLVSASMLSIDDGLADMHAESVDRTLPAELVVSQPRK